MNELLALKVTEGINELVDEELGSGECPVSYVFLINSNMLYIKEKYSVRAQLQKSVLISLRLRILTDKNSCARSLMNFDL